MVETQVIGFIPPITGVDGEFNTFRLGQALAKRLSAGDTVFLMNEKTKTVFGKAEVTKVETGLLGELCQTHAATNHREVGCEDPTQAPARLFKYIQKIYGPHIAVATKKSVVISMRRLE